jgi:ribosomal protein L20
MAIDHKSRVVPQGRTRRTRNRRFRRYWVGRFDAITVTGVSRY